MSQGLSVQAQAALAQRLQAGGVNGMNGGMALLPSHLCLAGFQHAVCDPLSSGWRVLAHVAGLDAIQEQQPYKGLSPGMLQALSQLGMRFLPSCPGCYTVLTNIHQLAPFLEPPASTYVKPMHTALFAARMPPYQSCFSLPSCFCSY